MSGNPGASICYNCGAALHGRYCADCGQEARPLNPNLRDVVREAAHEFLEVDGRIFRSVRRLFLSPGYLTKEAFAGRRAHWTSPVRLYLTFSLIYFAIMALGGTTNPSYDVRVIGKDGAAELRGLGFTSEQEIEGAMRQAMTVWMPRVMAVLVPLFAWLVGLVKRKTPWAYPQHLYFALHVHAAWFGALAVAQVLSFALPAVVGDALEGLGTFYFVAYVVAALRATYGGTWRRSILDAMIVLGLNAVVVALATFAIILPILTSRGWTPFQ
jgi:Protein of unknown function (DUF3667)